MPRRVRFYVDKVAEGVATIAAAFWPKPVIVRLSDFKSNEYRKLIGGSRYEPEEENPMLGFRGAARYISTISAKRLPWNAKRSSACATTWA
jgi:pyruvate,water dikinase